MEQALIELIEMVKGVAPDVWALALKQVEVEVFGGWLTAAVMLVLAILLGAGTAWQVRKENDGFDAQMALIMGTIAVLFTTAICIVSVHGVIVRTMNPGYYAIQALLALVGK